MQNQLTLAAEEVCANRIQHANNNDPKKPIEIRIYTEEKTLYIEICDFGAPYEFRKMDSALEKIAQNVREGKKRGLGIPIISKIADDIKFIQHGEQFICRLEKKLA